METQRHLNVQILLILLFLSYIYIIHMHAPRPSRFDSSAPSELDFYIRRPAGLSLRSRSNFGLFGSLSLSFICPLSDPPTIHSCSLKHAHTLSLCIPLSLPFSTKMNTQTLSSLSSNLFLIYYIRLLDWRQTGLGLLVLHQYPCSSTVFCSTLPSKHTLFASREGTRCTH